MTRPHVHNILVHFCHNAFNPNRLRRLGFSASKVINSTDDKDTFCRAYKKNDGWLVTKIQHEADMQAVHAQVAAEGGS